MDIAKNDDILEKSGYLLLDRATLIENYRKLQRHVGPEVTLIPVVKGNCYGYGAEEITDVLVNDCRVRVIGVGALCEGTAMRRRGVACDLMLLGGIAPQQYYIALHSDIIISIFRPECALAYEEALRGRGACRPHSDQDRDRHEPFGRPAGRGSCGAAHDAFRLSAPLRVRRVLALCYGDELCERRLHHRAA